MKIHSRIKDYTLERVNDFFSLKTRLIEEKRNYFFLIDEKIYSLYRDKMDHFCGVFQKILIRSEETSKTLPFIMNIYERLFEIGCKRNDVLIAIGGGILQDMSGFVASTLYRGVRWIFIPTTLLAQVDSCMGSKTALNFHQWKNQLGTFYPPDEVYIDSHFIETLSEKDFRSGLGEIIKVHLMRDEKAFLELVGYLNSKCLREISWLSKMIEQSLEIKHSYIESDEFDHGKRNLLNYGHCFGHALESATDFSVAHGEAVLFGIAFANLISHSRNILCNNEHERINRVLKPYFLSFDFYSVPLSKIVENMKRDKKRNGERMSMILLHTIGDLYKYDDITEMEIEAAYRTFQRQIMD